MSIVEATRALIQALKTEGTAGAAWGLRVHLHTSSQVVELGGEPVGETWPYLALEGPAVVENKARRAPFSKERFNANEGAATVQVQPFPRYYRLTFDVRFQARVAYSGAVSVTDQLLVAVERFNAWVARTPRVGGFDLVADVAMSSANAKRMTPADIREAQGRVYLRDVLVYHGTVATVDTTQNVVVGGGLEVDEDG